MALGVSRLDAVGDGKAEGAEMVGNDAEGHILLLLLGDGHDGSVARGTGERGTVGATRQLLNLREIGAEDVGFVIRNRRAEVGEVLRALHDAGNTFKSHACINMACRKRHKSSVRIGIELDEDKVPDLDALGASLIDEATLGVPILGEIDMEFGAGAAGACLPHHPEVVLFIAGDDVEGGIESLGQKKLRPERMGLGVKFSRVAQCFVRLIDRGVESLRGKAPDIHDQFPGPLDRFLFEIVAKRPVSEHLEEGVVVGVQPHILQIIVLAACADAFLRVSRTRRGVGAGRGAEEDRYELVHPRVGEEKIRRIGQQAGGSDDGVLLSAKEVEEGAADLCGGHCGVRKNKGDGEDCRKG